MQGEKLDVYVGEHCAVFTMVVNGAVTFAEYHRTDIVEPDEKGEGEYALRDSVKPRYTHTYKALGHEKVPAVQPRFSSSLRSLLQDFARI